MVNGLCLRFRCHSSGVLPNCLMRAANYNHRSMFDRRKSQKVIFSCGSPFVKCMNWHCNIHSGNVRLRENSSLRL